MGPRLDAFSDGAQAFCFDQISELTGSSPTSSDDAIRQALAKAAEKSPDIKWFEVVETRGQVVQGAVAHWQVTIKVGQTLG